MVTHPPPSQQSGPAPVIASLAHRCAFGMRCDVRPCLQWIDDSNTVFLCGANIVIYNPETRFQRFLSPCSSHQSSSNNNNNNSNNNNTTGSTTTSNANPASLTAGASTENGQAAQNTVANVLLTDEFKLSSAMAISPNRRYLAVAAIDVTVMQASAAAHSMSSYNGAAAAQSSVLPEILGTPSATPAVIALPNAHGSTPSAYGILVYDLTAMRKRKFLALPLHSALAPPADLNSSLNQAGQSTTSTSPLNAASKRQSVQQISQLQSRSGADDGSNLNNNKAQANFQQNAVSNQNNLVASPAAIAHATLSSTLLDNPYAQGISGTHAFAPSNPIASVCFSHDSRYIAVVTNDVPSIHIWIWEKSKLMQSARCPKPPAASITTAMTVALALGAANAGQITPGANLNSNRKFSSRASISSDIGAHTIQNLNPSSSHSNTGHGINAIGSVAGGNSVATTQQASYQIAFCPNDATQVSVQYSPPGMPALLCGSTFRLFRIAEGALKATGAYMKTDPRQPYLCHCWLSDTRVVAARAGGYIIFIDHGEVKGEFVNCSDRHAALDVFCIAPTAHGFLCGAQNGFVILFERTDEVPTACTPINTIYQASGGVFYRRAREFAVPEDYQSDVINIAIATNEENVIVTLRSGQTLSLSLSALESSATGNAKTTSGVGSTSIGTGSPYEPFGPGVHTDAITGLDTCVRKPLVVTCAADRSLRIWSFVDNSTELVKTFVEVPHSVSMHPSGLYLLVGFSDKLRLMNILVDDIRSFREFPIRACRECRFSTGGQYFAASNNNVIQIYNTWTFEFMGVLKGHSGKVRSIFWSPDDERLYSAGADGGVYEWSLRECRRLGESVVKSCSYTSAIAATSKANVLYAVGSDKTIKEIKDAQVVREIPSNVVATQIVLSHSGRMLFVGTKTGTIRSYRYPFPTTGNCEYHEHLGHATQVTKMAISYNDMYLFSTSDDGSMISWTLTDREGGGVHAEATAVGGTGVAGLQTSIQSTANQMALAARKEASYADEILVTKTDLEEKNAMMDEMRARVEELKTESQYQLRLKELSFKEKMKETRERYQEEIDALKTSITILSNEKDKDALRHDENLNDEQTRFAKEIEDIEQRQNAKMLAEHARFDELRERASTLEQQWQEQLEQLHANKIKTLTEMNADFELTLQAKHEEVTRLNERSRMQMREFDELNKEVEEDADQEVLLVKNKFEKRLRAERDVAITLKSENAVMKKKFNSLTCEIESHKGEIQKMLSEEKRMHVIIKSLEKDITDLKKEILERDEAIQDKEKRIYDLKKKNQELEKFKYVLDYKIKELRRQIEPREQEIVAMNDQIQQMQTELASSNKTNTSLSMRINDLKLKQRAAEKQISIEKSRLRYFETCMKHFKRDLNVTAQFVLEPKKLKSKVRDLYHTYCKNLGDPIETEVETSTTNLGSAAEDGVAPDPMGQSPTAASNQPAANEREKTSTSERARQRQFLEREITALRKRLLRDQQLHKTDHVKIMQENVILINEINRLRKEIDSKKKQVDLKLPLIGKQTSQSESSRESDTKTPHSADKNRA